MTDPASTLLGILFTACVAILLVGGGYAYKIHRRQARRHHKVD